MQRVCFLLKVRPEMIAQYRLRHEAVWDDMRQALTDAGWHNYSLFLREDGLLVGYVETPDFRQALTKMNSTEVNARWQAEMSPFFEALDGQRPDQSMRPLEQVFYLP